MEDKNKCPNPIGKVLVKGEFHDIACKSWRCPVCSRVKKLKLMRRYELNKGGFRYRMMTLTELKHPDNYTNSKELTKHWNRLRASLRKHDIILRDYFWVKEYKPIKDHWIEKQAKKYSAMEFHKAIEYIQKNYEREKRSYENDWRDTTNTTFMYPHMHISIPAYIDQKLVSRLWFKATNQTADQVHIPTDEEMKINNIVAYMTKYLLKSDMNDGFSKHERRYGCSRNYPAKEKPYHYCYDLDGVKIEGDYIPFGDNPEACLFLSKGNTTPVEVLLRNEKRLRYTYKEARQNLEELRKKFDDYFSRRYTLTIEESLEYHEVKENLHDIEDYLNFNGFSSYDKP